MSLIRSAILPLFSSIVWIVAGHSQMVAFSKTKLEFESLTQPEIHFCSPFADASSSGKLEFGFKIREGFLKTSLDLSQKPAIMDEVNLDLQKHSALPSSWTCWDLVKEDKEQGTQISWWLSDSNNPGIPAGRLMCEDSSCHFSFKDEDQDKEVEFSTDPQNIKAVGRISKENLAIISLRTYHGSEEDAWYIEIFSMKTIAEPVQNRRRQLGAIPLQELDSGVRAEYTLKCDSQVVTDCSKECPGMPYFFLSQAAYCTACDQDGQMPWDKTMSCQACSEDSNGITIGYYADPMGTICKPCHDSCMTCSGPNPENCLSCWTGGSVDYTITKTWKIQLDLQKEAYTNSRNPPPPPPPPPPSGRRLLQTPPGDACLQATTSTCQDSVKCDLCLASQPEFCLKCKTPFVITMDHVCSECSVDHGEYRYQNNRMCGSCPANCKYCSNSFSCNACDSEFPLFHPATPACVVSCPDGSFEFSNPNTFCKACHSSCLTCQGDDSPDSCLTCHPSKFLLIEVGFAKGFCLDDCPTGYFADANRDCKPCSTFCATCLPSNPNHCLSCFSTNEYVYPVNGTCSLCNQEGEFKIETMPKTCDHCDLSCKTCFEAGGAYCYSCHFGFGLQGTAPNTCIPCTSPNIIDSNNICTSSCSAGQFYDSTTLSCQFCPEGCTSCDVTGTTCSACDTNHGYYFTGSSCLPCTSLGCLQCPSGSPCLQCDSANFYFLDVDNPGQCRRCQANHGLIGGVCTLCSASCSSCSGTSSHCDYCAQDFQFDSLSHQCSPCLATQTWSIINGGTCWGCDLQCNQCEDLICNLCNPGYYVNFASNCLPCSVANCDVCSGPSTCAVCASGHTKSGGVCSTSTCLANQYWTAYDGGSCYSCTTHSTYCTACDATSCTTCQSPYVVSGTGCQLPTCDWTEYWSGTSCDPCPTRCDGCNGPDDTMNCFGCNSPYVFHNGGCTTTCTGATYWSSFGLGSCQPCSSHCTSCSDSTSCNACEPGYYVSGGNCLQCPLGCATCNGPSNTVDCQSCSSPYIFSAGSCTSMCSAVGRYWSPNNQGSCPLCSATWPQCTACFSTGCTACSTGYGPILPLGFHGCQACRTDQYWQAGMCYDCPTNCATCTGPSPSTDCQSCKPSYQFASPAPCSTTCPAGTYWSSAAQGSCIACTTFSPQCLFCSSTSCTVCANGFEPFGTGCQACGSNQYSMNGPCTNCHSNCATCTGPNPSFSCQSCNSPFKYLSNSCINTCAGNEYWTSINQGSCEACSTYSPQCLTCTSTGCSTCQVGYIVSGSSCVPTPCHSSCATCDGPDENECLSCPIGKGFDSFAKTCSDCTTGYYSQGPTSTCGTCMTAIQDCQACTTRTPAPTARLASPSFLELLE
jgi:proprotein convertase subtilisin/kexin type 5